MCHRMFYRRISQNKEYIEKFCIDINIPFHYACRQWYCYNKVQLQVFE